MKKVIIILIIIILISGFLYFFLTYDNPKIDKAYLALSTCESETSFFDEFKWSLEYKSTGFFKLKNWLIFQLIEYQD